MVALAGTGVPRNDLAPIWWTCPASTECPQLVDVSGADLDVLALVDQLARPTPKNPDGGPQNPARGPRFARLRGDRRETGAPGRAERPSKWRG